MASGGLETIWKQWMFMILPISTGRRQLLRSDEEEMEGDPFEEEEKRRWQEEEEKAKEAYFQMIKEEEERGYFRQTVSELIEETSAEEN